jgi:hypothetical protein
MSYNTLSISWRSETGKKSFAQAGKDLTAGRYPVLQLFQILI